MLEEERERDVVCYKFTLGLHRVNQPCLPQLVEERLYLCKRAASTLGVYGMNYGMYRWNGLME